MIWVRHGSCEKMPYAGNGMWLKNPIVRSGRASRSIRGTSCSW